MPIITKGRITINGWYERTDGSIGKYVWLNGNVVMTELVASWDKVPKK